MTPTDNTDGLLLFEPDDELSPLEIWCGTPTYHESVSVSPGLVRLTMSGYVYLG